MVRKTREEAEKTRKQIVDAARAVFHRCGVSRSTLEKIAQEAGVTRATAQAEYNRHIGALGLLELPDFEFGDPLL